MVALEPQEEVGEVSRKEVKKSRRACPSPVGAKLMERAVQTTSPLSLSNSSTAWPGRAPSLGIKQRGPFGPLESSMSAWKGFIGTS